MDCQVRFGDTESVVEMPLRFEALPRIGERIWLETDGDIYTGLVTAVEHQFWKNRPSSTLIDVERD